MGTIVQRALALAEKWRVTTFVLKFANDWSMNLASMLTYNLITAIFPILLAVLSLLGIALAAFGPATTANVAAAVNNAFPAILQKNGVDVTALLHNVVKLAGPFGVVSLVGLLWLGSNLFSNMENAFSIIFRIRGRDIIPQRLVAIGMVLLLTVLLPLSLGAASLVGTGSAWLHRILPGQAADALAAIGPLTSLGVLWVLFLVIYLVVPNFEVRFRQAWPGALVAALLFGLVQLLFPVYFSIFLQGNVRYGQEVFVLLAVIIWLWFFALVTIIGAQLNAIVMGLTPTPYDLARTFELVYEEHDLQADCKRSSDPRLVTRLVMRLLARGQRHRQLKQ